MAKQFSTTLKTLQLMNLLQCFSVSEMDHWKYEGFKNRKNVSIERSNGIIMMTSSNFPRHWPFVRGIHRSPVNAPHKGQWPRYWPFVNQLAGRFSSQRPETRIFSLTCAWTNAWSNNRDAGGLRRQHAQYDVTVMVKAVRGFIQHKDVVWPV